MSDVEYEIVTEEQPRKAGRKPKGEIPVEAKGMDIMAAEQQEKELTAEKALELYGDGQPYERFRYVEEIKVFLSMSKNSIMEAGYRLIILKANEEHGGWIHSLEQIGLARRTASRFMSVARRYGKWANLAHLNTAKQEALDCLTDPELEDLDEGKDVLGLNLDAIDKMTAKQLRETIREKEEKLQQEKEKRDQDIKSREKVIDEKNKKINELDKLLRGNPPTKEQIAQAVLDDDINKPYFGELGSILVSLQRACDLITQAQKIEGVNLIQLDTWVHRHDGLIKSLHENFQILTDKIDYIHVYKEGEDEEAETNEQLEE